MQQASCSYCKRCGQDPPMQPCLLRSGTAVNSLICTWPRSQQLQQVIAARAGSVLCFPGPLCCSVHCTLHARFLIPIALPAAEGLQAIDLPALPPALGRPRARAGAPKILESCPAEARLQAKALNFSPSATVRSRGLRPLPAANSRNSFSEEPVAAV